MPSKILTPIGDLGKNFKFLKEVKILSEFLRNRLACPMPIYVSGRPATKVDAAGCLNFGLPLWNAGGITLTIVIANMLGQRYKLFAIAALILLGALIYSNTFCGPFHFDDGAMIAENSAIRNIHNLRAIWDSWPTRFITGVSLALNYHFGRLNVFGYHLFNLLSHICASVMVWRLALLTFSTPAMIGKNITRHSGLIAFFVGLIFLLHPVQTQAVTYIIQRAASLTTLFYLACLCLYVKSRLLQEQGRAPAVSGLLYCGSVIAAVLAMFTKEIAITLPLMVLVCEGCFLKTKEKFGWKYPAPLLATLLIIPLTMFLTRFVDFAGMRNALEPLPSISPGQYLLTQFRVIVTYIRLLFIPVNQNLDYDYHIAKSLLELPTIAGLIFIASILAIAVKIFHRYRLISFGIFWFFLTLLPESSVIPIRDVIFEHRLYLPMVGFSFFLAGALYYIFEERSFRVMVILPLVITSCYAILSYGRNNIWKDELTLWDDTARKSPKKARPYNNRGNAYFEKGELASAISDFNRAIELDPKLAKVYNNRGSAYLTQGKLSQAMSDFNKAIEIDPNLVKAYNSRGDIYRAQGDLSRAISDFSKAIIINPNYAQAYDNRGAAYARQGSLSQALADFNKVIEIDPNYAEAYNNRGNVYYALNNPTQAILDYTKAIELSPNLAQAYSNRSMSYYAAKKYDAAWADLNKAKALGHAPNPKLLEALKKASDRDK